MSVFCAATLFPKYVLMEPSSIAIWHRNKVIMAVAIGLWVANIGVLSLGEYPPFHLFGILTDVV